MLDELLGGLLGSALVDLAKRRWPPRNVVGGELPWTDLRQRNGPIYILSLICSCVVFVLLLIYAYATPHRNGWLIGALFCFPVSVLVIAFFAATLPRGFHRVAEFVRYLELREKLNIWVLATLYAPLVALGILSILMITKGM